MPPSSQPEGELIPPQYHEAHARLVPDYVQETTQPRGRSFFSAPGTYFLVAINCVVFLLMVLRGVSPSSPTPNQLLHFGATNAALIFHGQWYRLLTATFVHVGLLHIATNMWCLWNLGLLGEPLLGPLGLVAVYMLTGIAGNLLSLGYSVWARDYISVGAGASGAVFGIAGILIVLLSNHKLPIPSFELKRLRRSVIQFAALNLIIGGATIFLPVIRIDNFAHLGGFLYGLVLGVPLVPRMTSGRTRYLNRQKITFIGAAFFLSLFGYWIANLR
jgi:rhomboid protease GluP